ncbi:MAG TPA: OmpH family outer membrane protein [Chitinophagaceae bacterium]|nr:OmpH family outer membrane protein [Chitinophagaceae bacterium]
MKYLSLVLSSLAIVGVIALFLMKSGDKKTARPIIKKLDSTGKEVLVAGSRIAYVDIDTLEANYDYFKRKKSEFESRQKNIDADLEKSANALQNEYIALQKRAQSGQLSEAEGETAQQRLMQKQQELELKRQNLGTKYMKDQEAFNKEIHDNLHKYIELYNEEKGYDYILSYSKDGSILYANKENDITRDIIEGMNSKGFEKEMSANSDTTK